MTVHTPAKHATVIILSMSFLLFACYSSIAEQNVAPPPPPGRLVDVQGHRVHIYCTGQGRPAVVVVSGGFSVDWALVQPAVAQRTQICTYDPEGVAWSDPLPDNHAPTPHERVDELHTLLLNAQITPPFILVGYSIGGLVARLYSALFPQQTAGLVVVDHAFIDTPKSADSAAPQQAIDSASADSPPLLIDKTPISLDLTDDVNFQKLPSSAQQAHRWALSIHSFRPPPELASKYFDDLKQVEQQPFPLGDKPVAVVSTLYDAPQYRELQRTLLALSHRSKQFIADKSTHMVTIDQPETIDLAIDWVLSQVARQLPNELRGMRL
jgi:pimeloyl-ACP methyl ester carboxylesterase